MCCFLDFVGTTIVLTLSFGSLFRGKWLKIILKSPFKEWTEFMSKIKLLLWRFVVQDYLKLQYKNKVT